MAQQTLIQAIHLAYSGLSRDLRLALGTMGGTHPTDGLSDQAYRQMTEFLPIRSQRSYTSQQFLDSCWSLDFAGRYQLRSETDAMGTATAIEVAQAGPRISRDTDTHPAGTVYDVLVPSHAARLRGATLDDALVALRQMRSETPDCILVAHTPDGQTLSGCYGSWEQLDGQVYCWPDTLQTSRRTNHVARTIEIVSGEGSGDGTVESYTGAQTTRAILSRLTRERCGGDRWAFCRIDGERCDAPRLRQLLG